MTDDRALGPDAAQQATQGIHAAIVDDHACFPEFLPWIIHSGMAVLDSSQRTETSRETP
ncbi:hypothetical protein GCM10023257_04390 [Streptomyces hyderabadensis]|uniref:Uncharacterized protein n=1 Tax=Streptomyces hyderabadensis TaxID=598549 RepID=A0ABP9HI53_9ACTN